MMKTSARATLTPDNRLEIACATADIGTGTYTILTQIGADAFGLSMEAVTTKLGDSSLPTSPVAGGSWTAASAGTAVQLACDAVRATMLKHAKSAGNSPLAKAGLEDVTFANGRIEVTADPARYVTFEEAMAAGGVDKVEAEETASPSKLEQLRFTGYTHSAVFVEVRVDEDLGAVRVTRVVDAVAAGRILNPKTARSQVIGAMTMGVGAALMEEAVVDTRFGCFINHDLAEYHVPVHADIPHQEVVFLDEVDPVSSPMKAKGVGELGLCGVGGAVANAIYNATGVRVRDYPITLDKLLDRLPEVA